VALCGDSYEISSWVSDFPTILIIGFVHVRSGIGTVSGNEGILAPTTLKLCTTAVIIYPGLSLKGALASVS